MMKNYWKSISDLWNTYDAAKTILTGIVLGVALTLGDYYDVPLQLIYSIPCEIVWVILAAVVIIVTIWLLDNHCFDLFRIAATNPVDVAAIVIIIASLVYIPVRWWLVGLALYINIAACLSGVLLLVLLVRIMIRANKYAKAARKSSNLVDLKDLYDNKISRVADMPILVRENDVDYDLFDRSEIVNRLYRSIVHCRPEASYVISLEGEWGCGKTTIINNVKRLLDGPTLGNDDVVIIDDFDPWLFGSQEALLLAMYDTLLQHMGLRYSPLRSSWIVKGITQVVSENHTAGGLIFNLLHNKRKSNNDIQVLKKRISAYLRTSNKRIVFFVDNLDRANDENIVFLFKLIGIVFDLPGVVYVLSFEKERISTILKETKEIDQRFTEKIIQQEVKVPAIGEEKSQNVYSVCVYNLLEAYGISGEEIMGLAPVLKYIIKQTQNVRMFKRILNSVFPTVFCSETYLNKSDLLAIEAIRFFDPELYTKIYKNSRFFVSHEKSRYESFLVGSSGKEFNGQGAAFFEDLLKQHAASKDLLKAMFPYVERYIQSNILEHDSHFRDPRSSEIARQSRICSGKYFDLYFSYSTNGFLETRKKIKHFLERANGVESLERAVDVVTEALGMLTEDNHSEWVEQLQCHIPDILPVKAYYIASGIYAKLYKFNDSATFLALTPQSRAEYILSELLIICTDEEFAAFQENTKADYRRLHVIESILYWLKNSDTPNQERSKKRAELLAQQCQTMCDEILSEGINIYSEEYYQRGNAWVLYHYCKEKEDIPMFTAYIKGVLSSATVYKMLWDVSSLSIGDNYRYSIEEGNLAPFCDDKESLSDLVRSTPPRTVDEEFVAKIYDSYVNGVEDVFGHKGVVTSRPKGLVL